MRSLLILFIILAGSNIGLSGIEQTNDSTGKTLQQVRDNYYDQILSKQGELSQCTYLKLNGKAHQVIQLHQANFRSFSSYLSDADRLNGIDFKVSTLVKSKSYRERSPNSKKWSKWKPGTPAVLIHMGTTIERKHGRFVITPTSGAKLFKKRVLKRGKTPRTLKDLAS